MTSNLPEEKGVETQANRPSEGELSEEARPLFVLGCPRSGTTAFADYVNQHPRILVCQERYRGVAPADISRNLFNFERLLDFKPRERKRAPGGDLELHMMRHAEILARKDPAKLKWIGDKGPWYVRSMNVVTENNPGARFIVLYRPIEEVAESWDARAKDPNHPWPSDRGVEVAVQTWNLALRKVQEFIQSSPTPRVLIVDYHDFFSHNEAVTPLISRFLGIEFGESVIETWGEASSEFEGRRRPKEPLDAQQLSFIREHADRAAEAWVLERIERQTREPGLYVEESVEAALASLNEAEARAWRLRQRVKRLEDDLADERREARRLRKKARRLKAQMRNLQELETRTTSDTLSRIRNELSRKLRRQS